MDRSELQRISGKVSKVYFSRMFGEDIMDVEVDGKLVYCVQSDEPCIGDNVSYKTREGYRGKPHHVKEQSNE